MIPDWFDGGRGSYLDLVYRFGPCLVIIESCQCGEVVMVLVTACLIFKWIHQTFSSEQSTQETTKMRTKTWEQKVTYEKINQFNNKYSRTEEFAYKARHIMYKDNYIKL